MRLSPPERFQVSNAGKSFVIESLQGESRFRGAAATRCPKLYIISAVEEVPIYIGATIQCMRTRLRQGWTASGFSGYYGYAWRSSANRLKLDIFYLLDCPEDEWQRQLKLRDSSSQVRIQPSPSGRSGSLKRSK